MNHSTRPAVGRSTRRSISESEAVQAQVAAASRLATVRYREALMAARDDMVAQIEALPDHLRHADPEDFDRLDRKTQILAQADQLDLLTLDFVPVISGSNNDDPTWAQWTDKARPGRRH